MKRYLALASSLLLAGTLGACSTSELPGGGPKVPPLPEPKAGSVSASTKKACRTFVSTYNKLDSPKTRAKASKDLKGVVTTLEKTTNSSELKALIRGAGWAASLGAQQQLLSYRPVKELCLVYTK